MATEAQLVTLFAALVTIGAVVILFVPIVRKAWDRAAGPLGYGTVLIGMLAACVVAVAIVTLTASDPAFAAPLVVIVIGLRLSSPSLLYLRLRSKYETKRLWEPLRVLLVLGFLGLAASLVGKAIRLFPETTTLALGLSEQILMAYGAASLFARVVFRVRPVGADGVWPMWLGGMLFGVAFLVVAPYAFPEFAFYYVLSGLAGWAIGAVIAYLFG